MTCILLLCHVSSSSSLPPGRVDLAIQLYSDLKRWEDARDIAASTTGTDIKDLTREQV